MTVKQLSKSLAATANSEPLSQPMVRLNERFWHVGSGFCVTEICIVDMKDLRLTTLSHEARFHTDEYITNNEQPSFH